MGQDENAQPLTSPRGGDVTTKLRGKERPIELSHNACLCEPICRLVWQSVLTKAHFSKRETASTSCFASCG